jgi:hypothetical protein
MTIRFYPSHLAKGLIAGALSGITGIYALREFLLTNPEEIRAFIDPPKP